MLLNLTKEEYNNLLFYLMNTNQDLYNMITEATTKKDLTILQCVLEVTEGRTLEIEIIEDGAYHRKGMKGYLIGVNNGLYPDEYEFIFDEFDYADHNQILEDERSLRYSNCKNSLDETLLDTETDEVDRHKMPTSFKVIG